MAGSSGAPVIAGLAAGIAFIVLFSTMSTSAFVYYPRYHFPRYDLGDKDELVSKLSEYFAREPNNAVRVEKGGFVGRVDYIDIYAYQLIADYDSKNHGALQIFTYRDEVRVQAVGIKWRTHGEPELVNAKNLMVSGIADNTIPDWQIDDGEPNRNVQMLNWIDANTECEKRAIEKDDLGQQRKLYLVACEENLPLLRVEIKQ